MTLNECYGDVTPAKCVETFNGYRLFAPKGVERIASPTASIADTLGEIADDRMKMHSVPSLQVSVKHYREVLKAGPDVNAYGELAKAYINLGHVGLCQMPSVITSKAANEYHLKTGQ